MNLTDVCAFMSSILFNCPNNLWNNSFVNNFGRACRHDGGFLIYLMLQKKYIKEEKITTRDYVRFAFRQKWLVIVYFIISVTTVIIFSIKVTPIYQATTLVMIARDKPNVVSFEDVSLNYSEPCVSPNMSETVFE